MKVLVDENIPLLTVEELRLKGFDVTDIRGSAEQGITDEVGFANLKLTPQ